MEEFLHSMNFSQFEELNRRFFKQHGREREVGIFRVTLIITTVILSIVCIVGSIGNSLVIYVFSHHLRHGVSNLFITLLAVIDLVICLVDIPATLYWTVWQRDSVDLVCKVHSTLKAFFIPVSASILVLIAVDRFLLICFVPGIKLKARTTSTSLLTTIVFGICLAVPCGLHSGVRDGIPLSTQDFLVSHSINLSFSSYEPNPHYGNDSFSEYPSTLLVGPCQPDETYITNTQFKHYTLSVFGVFILMFVALTLLYSITFSFIWWRQHTWNKRYGRHSSSRCVRKERQNDGTSSYLTCETPTKIKYVEEIEMATAAGDNPKPNKDEVFKDHIPVVPTHSGSLRKKFLRRRKDRGSLNDANYKRRKPHIRTAQTLALVTVLFFCSYMPYLLIINEFIWSEPILQLAQFNHHQEPSVSQHLKRLFFFMYFVNSATNPIIYSCMNRTFRSDVLALLRRLKLIPSQ